MNVFQNSQVFRVLRRFCVTSVHSIEVKKECFCVRYLFVTGVNGDSNENSYMIVSGGCLLKERNIKIIFFDWKAFE